VSDDLLFRVWLALWLFCLVMSVGLSVTHRVIVAWWTYFHLRRRYRRHMRRWLWLKTLDYANGSTRESRKRRAAQ